MDGLKQLGERSLTSAEAILTSFSAPVLASFLWGAAGGLMGWTCRTHGRQ